MKYDKFDDIPKGKYSIVYADPPWGFEREDQHIAPVQDYIYEKQYDLMSNADLNALPVNEITTDDAWLFMWTTPCFMEKAFDTINAWGFTYKTIAFVWAKSTRHEKLWPGLGWYTRQQAEVCYLATKGEVHRKSKSVGTMLWDVRRKHSQKPNSTRNKIVQLCGDLPRIELFAREHGYGFDTFGNETIDVSVREKNIKKFFWWD